MGEFFQQIVNLVLEPPGNLVYHLIMAFSVAGAFSLALGVWKASPTTQAKRTVFGLGLLIVLRLVLFILVGLAWQGVLNQRILLPVLDRGINLLCLVVIVWLWVFPKPSRAGDAATILLALVVITFFTLSLVWWSAQPLGQSYNGSWSDLAAAMLSLGISTSGSLLLLIRRPSGWGYGLAMLGIFMIGDIAYLTYPYPDGDYPGTLRLAQLVAYPLLLVLPSRLSVLPTAPEPVQAQSPGSELQPGAGEAVQPPARLVSDYQALFALGLQTDPANICQEIAKSVSHEWMADICLVVSPPGPHGSMSILCGYDLIREQSMSSAQMNSQSIPVIASALRRGRSVRLPANSTSPDIHGLEQVLELKQIGHLLAAPLSDSQGTLLVGLILLTPYTRHGWSADDQLRLTDYTRPLAQVLQHSRMITALREDLERSQAALKVTQVEVESFKKENESLFGNYGIDSAPSSSSVLQATSLAALITAQEEAQETINQLRAENARLLHATFALEEAAGSDKVHILAGGLDQSEDASQYLEGELRLALEEIARLKTTIFEADRSLLEMRRALAQISPEGSQFREIVARMQNLRQPMSSIVGYTDFLLGESIGILGTLQRRFLERIRSSADRMQGQIDELVALTGDETSLLQLPVETVMLSGVIDSAIVRTSNQLREKNISLRMEMPEDLPDLRMNPATLEKLLVNLLENAGGVTPEGGEISMRVQMKSDDTSNEYVLIRVSDQGEGIAPQDLLAIFSDISPADSRNIQGISQNAESLSLMKAHAESMGGRIWVESAAGKGATFSLLFPVAVTALSKVSRDRVEA
jgi:signal transduction histidine kinase